MIKATLIFIAQLTYFMVISVPMAIVLLLISSLFFQIKRIIKWIKI
jgi:hypothetical protein